MPSHINDHIPTDANAPTIDHIDELHAHIETCFSELKQHISDHFASIAKAPEPAPEPAPEAAPKSTEEPDSPSAA